MSLQEFKNKSAVELEKLLAEKKDSLRTMRFKVAQRQLKKVHAVKNTKKEIARLSTYLQAAEKQAQQ